MPPKPNGFMVFTKEWKNKYGKKMSLREATAEAGKIWKDMNAAARSPYNEKAKTLKFSPQEPDIKYTCTGRPLSEVENEKNDVETKEKNMKRFIEDTVNNSVKDKTLLTQKYFFLMVNHYSKTLRGNCYIPAEVSVAEFTIKDGVVRTYHRIINPGEIYGQRYNAQLQSESTHRIPLPPHSLGTSDLGKVYNDILEFIYDEEIDSFGPVYTLKNERLIVESVLNFLKADPSAREEVDIPILSLEYLLFILLDVANEISESDEKIESPFIMETIIENDNFEFAGGIACDFHEENDKTKYCTLSYVQRWAFMFCDMLCIKLAVDMIPGHHKPPELRLAAVINDPNKTESYKHRSDIDDDKSYLRSESLASYMSDVTSAVGAASYYEKIPRQRNRQKASRRQNNATFSVDESHNYTMPMEAPPPPIIRTRDDAHLTKFELGSTAYGENPWARDFSKGDVPDDSYFEMSSDAGTSRSFGRGRDRGRDRDDDFPPLVGAGRGRGRGRGHRF